MRVIEPEIDEQVVSSGWTNAIAILMIVLGIIAIVFPFFAGVAIWNFSSGKSICRGACPDVSVGYYYFCARRDLSVNGISNAPDFI
jgi:hypothetical protein